MVKPLVNLFLRHSKDLSCDILVMLAHAGRSKLCIWGLGEPEWRPRERDNPKLPMLQPPEVTPFPKVGVFHQISIALCYRSGHARCLHHGLYLFRSVALGPL